MYMYIWGNSCKYIMAISEHGILSHMYFFLLDVYSFIWRRQWHPTPVLLPGESHGQRSLVGCSP